MLSVTLHERIDAIDPERWDAVGTDPLSCHRMLSALERAELPGVRLWYALVEDARGTTVAAAPLTRIAIDGEHLTHGAFRRLIRAVRVARPDFLRTSLLACGTPLSVGNAPLRAAEGVDHVRVTQVLATRLGELADAEKAPWRVFKEFGLRHLATANLALLDNGRPWVLAPSEPNASIDLCWESFDRYLASLRGHYRYKIRAAARKMAGAGVSVEVTSLAEAYDHTFHALYEAVLERANVRFEHLTPLFFQLLGRAFGDAAPFLVFRRGDRVVGWVAMLVWEGTAYDLFHGIDYAENEESALYFNQLAAVVRVAIERRARRLSLGQSTETAKARFGARAVPLWIGLQHRRRAVTSALRAGQGVLFPDHAVPERHVFREPCRS